MESSRALGSFDKRHGREVIHIQVGKAGNMIGNEFWRDLCVEHRIQMEKEETRGYYYGDDRIYGEYLNVFFNESSSKRWVPRAILLDLNMQDLYTVAQDKVADCYKPENIIGNDEGSGNCYAKAFHTEGPDLADRCLETVRKEAERCECLQGVQFVHSVSGGTGSGLTGLLMKTLYDYFDKQGKIIMQSFALVPAAGTQDVVVEPYNAALGLQDLLEYSDQVFVFDNSALTDIAMKTLELDLPKPNDLNNLVAKVMSSITSCLRFNGPLNSDLRKMKTNLVPFKHAHFLINGYAPLTASSNKKYRNVSIKDLAQQMISKDNVTVKCDPLNPGDSREGILRARFLASWASWRGKNLMSKEVDQTVYELAKPNSRYDLFFPDWIPNSIAGNICNVPHAESSGAPSVCFTSNNTAVHEVFDRVISTWDKFYDKRAFMHVFEQDGISQQDMMESRNILQYISDFYCELAKRDDKVLQETGGATIVKDSAIRNDEQMGIAQELKDLKRGEMGVVGVDPAKSRRPL
eukprot:TRINITY_DN71548_c0_g1_i1.p1 TRINITY_DN71548_c0_g1~~TRINITY_DN71548_c0_g1_i1.p1  ORF type:complete len:520 (-),score=108.47 TRINITY_DN71548_c0_g1_i1:41-1600(-)